MPLRSVTSCLRGEARSRAKTICSANEEERRNGVKAEQDASAKRYQLLERRSAKQGKYGKMYIVYVLKSKKFPQRCYVGLTKDVKRRVREHNIGDSSYTKKYGPWKLKTYITFEEKEQAASFEKYLKSGSGFSFLKRRLL